MLFGTMKFDLVSTDELRQLAWQGRELTKNGYRQNKTQAFALLDKILAVSRNQRDWYVYFDALYYMLYMQTEYGSDKKVLQYAEIFYRDVQKYFDNALPGYSRTDMSETRTFSYGYIFRAYKEFYQVDDTKLESFMKIYRQTAETYGGLGQYYRSVMRLALLYRDRELARQADEGLMRNEDMGCYICFHKPIIGYYILMDEPEEALDMMHRIVERRIPASRQWCYNSCQNGTTHDQYDNFLSYCVLLGRADLFHKHLHVYQEAAEALSDEEANYTQRAFLRASYGDFSLLKLDVENMIEDEEGRESSATMNIIFDSLTWYAYFTLLHRAGTERVALGGNPPKTLPPAGAEGTCASLEIAAHFERVADELGAKFEASRKKFSYAALKQSYMDCAGL